MTKHIFVTGGVVSSLGKGLTCASIGMLLESRGLRVRMQKLDPYLNILPGILSPFQHGEVYVLDDGSETDLDLGHYERFTSDRLTRHSSWTTGLLYQEMGEKERAGEYKGATIQVIPHVTSIIKEKIAYLDRDDVDVVITEIGGTVGDMESLPHMEAIRQFANDIGKQNCLFIHLTLIPYLKAARELKTKPTQHSVGRLLSIGIQPDMIVCRTEQPIPEEERAKIALFCNVPANCVVEERDADFSIYEVPMALHANKMDETIVNLLGLKAAEPNLTAWREMLDRMHNPEQEITIAVVGRYADHKDAYKSVYEALDHAGGANRTQVRIRRIDSENVTRQETRQILENVDGIIVPGGFGERTVKGTVEAVQIAREKGIPFFGVALGIQSAMIEFGRNVLGMAGADSTEYDRTCEDPIFCLLQDDKDPEDGVRRGSRKVKLAPGSKVAQIYGAESAEERHRHRYEFDFGYQSKFEEGGAVLSGKTETGNHLEVMELPNHPWFVAVAYHPEFKSQPTKPHPLFADFVAAAVKHRA
ncbi:MAG: CTP synthase [Thermoguttaceae bacterium]|nr:CTP synthase [Thermoguttaceae bacterium]